MTSLAHTDKMLALRKGSTVQLAASLSALDMVAGGRIPYPMGAVFRVIRGDPYGMSCFDSNGRRVYFWRHDLAMMDPRDA